MTNNNSPNLPDLIRKVNPATISAMERKIDKALRERTQFELTERPNASHVHLRKAQRILGHNRTFAAFLCVCNANPDTMLNKSRKYGYRANIKGIPKLANLVDYITGKTGRFDRINLALFAATIVAALSGIDWISNADQEHMLGAMPLGGVSNEVQEAIAEYKHKYLAGNARPDASLFRTTFDNLGAYTVSNEDMPDANRNGINVNLDHPVIQYLIARWHLKGVK